ncbi:MAG: MFS transporter [Rhodoferax sp.]|nr:MFS transporter [Rhodoferax sp.]
MTNTAHHRHTLGACYGLLALPLSFVALPMYVNLPHFYATQYAIPLTTLGLVLLLSRLLDAVVDPWLGRLSDLVYGRSHQLLGWVATALTVLLLLSFGALFLPPDFSATHAYVAWVAVCVSLCHLTYSGLGILHQAWATRLGGGALQQGRVIAWREGAGLVGVVLASLLPALVGWTWTTLLLGLLLALGLWTWQRVFQAVPSTLPLQPPSQRSAAVTLPLQQGLFLKLLCVFMLNGIASAVPASLVLFFVEDLIQASPHIAPWFLGVYFLAGVLSLPVWLALIRRVGLTKAWAVGMLLALLGFAGVSYLGPGDEWAFLAVCIASGVALGADMVVPGALLNRVIDHLGHRGRAEGLYLGWWNLITKFNLALAAGLCLPLLELLGYAPGVQTATGLSALSLAYGVLPCVLKALALVALVYFWIQPGKSGQLPFLGSTASLRAGIKE